LGGNPMSKHSEALRNILKWAAGADEPPPEGHTVDTTALLALARRHRLCGRLLQRVRALSVPPDWCPASLVTELRSRHLRAALAQEQKVAAYREIRSALSGAEPPLPIKGWTTYALTGERRHIRVSGDLDLVCPDPEGLTRTLRTLGYVGEVLDGGRHEYAHLRRGSVAIEIHRYFPVYAYPPGVLATADRLPPDGRDAVRPQAFVPPLRRDLNYADISEAIICGKAIGMEDLMVPDPTMAAFLLCTHEFKEYLTSPLDLPIPIRLGVLADIRDLTLHPGFRPERFVALAARFGAEDAVALTDRLLTCWLGFPLSSARGMDIGPQVFPRQLGFRGVWANLYPAEDGIVPPDRATLLARLSRSGSRRSNGVALEHTLRDSWSSLLSAERVAFVRSEEGVTVTLMLPLLTDSGLRFRIRADWQGDQENACAVELDGKGMSVSGPGRVVMDQDARQQRLHIQIAQNWFAASAWEGDGANILLTLMILTPESQDFFDAVYVATKVLIDEEYSTLSERNLQSHINMVYYANAIVM
jgi:hypothetical protein